MFNLGSPDTTLAKQKLELVSEKLNALFPSDAQKKSRSYDYSQGAQDMLLDAKLIIKKEIEAL